MSRSSLTSGFGGVDATFAVGDGQQLATSAIHSHLMVERLACRDIQSPCIPSKMRSRRSRRASSASTPKWCRCARRADASLPLRSRAPRALPGFDNSAMDGYAVRAGRAARDVPDPQHDRSGRRGRRRDPRARRGADLHRRTDAKAARHRRDPGRRDARGRSGTSRCPRRRAAITCGSPARTSRPASVRSPSACGSAPASWGCSPRSA